MICLCCLTASDWLQTIKQVFTKQKHRLCFLFPLCGVSEGLWEIFILFQNVESKMIIWRWRASFCCLTNKEQSGSKSVRTLYGRPSVKYIDMTFDLMFASFQLDLMQFDWLQICPHVCSDSTRSEFSHTWPLFLCVYSACTNCTD